MPRLNVVLFLILLTTGLEAQLYEKSFALEVAPHLGGRRISGGALVEFTELERQEELEDGIGGFGVGLLFESRADKVGFTTGLRYLETGYEIVDPGEDGPVLGFDLTDQVRAKYLSIPMELNFHQSITDKDRAFFMLGIAAHVHLNTSTERTTTFDGEDRGTETLPEDPELVYRPVNISLNTGIGYDRKLGNDWAVKIQPYFQFFLRGNLQADDRQLNRNYYQTGVRVVVKRIFSSVSL